MAVEFSFGQVEAVCASLNRIADDKRVAFMSRLKQLQKQGLTEKGSRPGRGKAGTYSFGDLMRFVISLELIQAGLMPQMAARIVSGSWDLLRFNIYVCSFAPEETVGFGRKPTEYLWMLSPEALRGLTRDGETEWDHMERIQAVPIEEAAKELARGVNTDPEHIGEGWRTLVLNGYNLTQRVMKVVAFYFNYASRAELRSDIEAEIEAFNADVRELGETLRSLGPPTPEMAEKVRRRLAEFDQMDWTTNPPTPRHVLVERADEMIPLLPSRIKDFLSGPAQDRFVLDEQTKEMVGELITLNILTVEEVEVEGETDADVPATIEDAAANPDSITRLGIAFTPFGRALVKRLGGPWAEALATADKKPREDPLAEAADDVIDALPDEVREKIRSDANVFEEPYHGQLLHFGLLETGEADFPFDRSGKWTELGRAVSFALRFGRHARGIEKSIEAVKSFADDHK